MIDEQETNAKHARLRELARRRQASRWEGYKCIGDYHSGAYECEFVSPYTKSAGNVDSDLMIFLQDWASDDVLRGPFLPERITVGHDPRRGTNRNLREVLRRHFALELEEVYATNLFPFVKLGPMKTSIPRQDLIRAAQDFALLQIEIVAPRFVVCLGLATFNGLADACGRPRAKLLEDAIASPFRIGETQVWCQAHTGRLGTNNRNRDGVDRVETDWKYMASAYNKSLQPTPRCARGG